MAAVIDSWLGVFIGPLVLVFLGVVLRLLIKELLRLSAENEVPAFESNWGGMGRGSGGWSVNRMMVISLLTLLVLLMFGSVAYKLLPDTIGAKNRTEDNQPLEKQGEQKQQGRPSSSASANPDKGNPSDSPRNAATSSAGKSEGTSK
jgi:predicted PurR-regulated permease PerM